jgi:hypothetical protein
MKCPFALVLKYKVQWRGQGFSSIGQKLLEVQKSIGQGDFFRNVLSWKKQSSKHFLEQLPICPRLAMPLIK